MSGSGRTRSGGIKVSSHFYLLSVVSINRLRSIILSSNRSANWRQRAALQRGRWIWLSRNSAQLIPGCSAVFHTWWTHQQLCVPFQSWRATWVLPARRQPRSSWLLLVARVGHPSVVKHRTDLPIVVNQERRRSSMLIIDDCFRHFGERIPLTTAVC